MKYYNYDKAVKLIEENKDNLTSASMGMHEDWFWTAETVWEDGAYVKDFLTNEQATRMYDEYIQARRKDNEKDEADKTEITKDNYASYLEEKTKRMVEYRQCLIGGIMGSPWATPVIQLEFKDGTERFIECSYGEQDITDNERTIKKSMWSGGVLSQPIQDNIKPIEKDET